MAIKLKANIAYGSHLDSVSRKFVPRSETCTNLGTEAGPVKLGANGWMGGAVRKSVRAGLGACQRNYVVMRVNARQTAPSNAEITVRTNFEKAVKGRKFILGDLEQLTNVQALFMTAKDDFSKTLNGVSAYGYTYKGWVMAVQMAGLKENPTYNANQFPTRFDA